MAIDIDGYAVLGAIARERRAFSAIQNEVSKAARSLVVKQLKEKSLTLQKLQAISGAIQHESLVLILDLMSDAEIKSLLTKVDKFNLEAKNNSPQAQRKQISNLAKGAISAAVKPVAGKVTKTAKATTSKAPRVAKPKVERAINTKAFKATKKV